MEKSKKIKILFVSDASGLCGSERSLLNLLEGLNKAKYDPLILMPKNGLLKDQVELLGFRVIVYPIERWVINPLKYSKDHFIKVFIGLPKRVYFLCKLIKKEKIDLVYSNSILVIDDAIAAKIRHVPHIRHIRNFLYNNSTLRAYLPIPLISILVKFLSSKIIVVSDAIRKSYNFEKISRYGARVRVIHNGVDIEKFSAHNSLNAKDNLRKELGLGKEIKIIGLLGRYQAEKGVKEFVEAAKIVTDCFQNVMFVLIGNRCQSTYSRLKILAQDLRLENRLCFLDFRTDIIPIFHSIDILVSASWFEAYPRSILEAMAAGKPVVATKCGGPEEIVVDGETGFLIPLKSPKDLASAIIKLLNNPELAQEMGRLGQKRAMQEFGLEKYVCNIENVIDEVINEETAGFNLMALNEALLASIKILIKKVNCRIYNKLQIAFFHNDKGPYLKTGWRFIIRHATMKMRRKVYILLEDQYSSSSIIRGYQIGSELQKNGIQADVMNLRFESKQGYKKIKRVKNSSIIFVKRAFKNNENLLSFLKENKNILIWDPLDVIIDLVEEKGVNLFDGVMLSNHQCIKDIQRYFKKDCLYGVVHQQWDLKCNITQAKDYSLVYIGDPTPENIDIEYIKNISELHIIKCSSTKEAEGNRLFQEAMNHNCHFSVRKENSPSFNYKPGAKLLFSAGCHSNIILSRDYSNVELLDPSYPYYTSSDLKSVLETVRYSKDTYLTDIWHRALGMIKEVREKTSIEMVCKNYIHYLKRF